MEIKNKDEWASTFKKRLELICVKLQLSMEQLAEKGGISKPTLYKFINEGISDKNHKSFVSFCMLLKVNSDWLLEEKGEMFTSPEITTQSTDIIVQELIKQVNYLRSQVLTFGDELKSKDDTIKSQQTTIAELALRIPKLEATSEEPQEETKCVEYDISPVKREFKGLRVIGG
jgi:transcriptional regulator with XRE-family HTH domain